MVVPVDLANKEDVGFIVQYLYVFVKRMIPVRFGLVPILHTEESKAQAKIAYHLQKTYGLASLLKYLEQVSFSFVLCRIIANSVDCFIRKTRQS